MATENYHSSDEEAFRGISLDNEGMIREAKVRVLMGQGGRRDRKWSEGNRAGEGGGAGGREGRPWIRLSSIILLDETETKGRGHWRHWTNKSPGNYYAVSKYVSGSRSQKG